MKSIAQELSPSDEFVNLSIIIGLSCAISFVLIGRQVFQANWGMIDDHEIFNFLGPTLHLDFSEIWNTLLSKTEVGSLQGRFRPGYYVFKLIETSLWGANVQLWYLARTASFALFLSSIWYYLRRFTGNWLSAVLTIYIALLPLWGGVWSRLGPSEIYGAACIGAMIFAGYFTMFSKACLARSISAAILVFTSVVFVTLKETFLPIAWGPPLLLILACAQKKLSVVFTAFLTVALSVCVMGIALVINEQVSSGTDFYANAVGLETLSHLQSWDSPPPSGALGGST